MNWKVLALPAILLIFCDYASATMLSMDTIVETSKTHLNERVPMAEPLREPASLPGVTPLLLPEYFPEEAKAEQRFAVPALDSPFSDITRPLPGAAFGNNFTTPW